MHNLIFKEFILQKWSLLFLPILYSIFLGFVFLKEEPQYQGILYISGACLLVIILFLRSLRYEEKNRGEIIFNSLPLKRRDIVNARYLGAFALTVLILLIFVLSVALFKLFSPFTVYLMGVDDIIISFLLVAAWVSVYLPFYYWLGEKYLPILQFVSVMLIFVLMFSLSEILVFLQACAASPVLTQIRLILQQFGELPPWLLPGLMVLLIILLSRAISLKLYQKRDL